MLKASQEIRFDTRADYRLAIDTVLESAAREICVFDPDLKGLEFDNHGRAESLAAFLSASRDRSLRIVLHNTDFVTRDCPRLISLLKRFSDTLSIRQTPDNLRNLADCFVLADNACVAVRFHADHYRGKLLLFLPDEVQAWRQRFEDLWEESAPAVSATCLGL